MNTFLGACVALGRGDVDAALVAGAQVVYLEGYLFDPPARQGRVPAGGRGPRTRPGGRWRSPVRPVLRRPPPRRVPRSGARHVDILFANEAEICSLYEVNDFDDAAAAARGRCRARGADPQRGRQRRRARRRDDRDRGRAGRAWWTPPAPATSTPPASSAALTAGRGLAACGRMGSIAAAEVIGHFGARPADRPAATGRRRDGLRQPHGLVGITEAKPSGGLAFLSHGPRVRARIPC